MKTEKIKKEQPTVKKVQLIRNSITNKVYKKTRRFKQEEDLEKDKDIIEKIPTAFDVKKRPNAKRAMAMLVLDLMGKGYTYFDIEYILIEKGYTKRGADRIMRTLRGIINDQIKENASYVASENTLMLRKIIQKSFEINDLKSANTAIDILNKMSEVYKTQETTFDGSIKFVFGDINKKEEDKEEEDNG